MIPPDRCGCSMASILQMDRLIHTSSTSHIYRICLTSMLLLSLTASADGLITQTFEGFTGSYGNFASPNFPDKYPLEGEVYAYEFYNEWGTVRLTFSDFSLHERSVLKIFDGDSSPLSVSTWRGRNTPVYQSQGQKLYVVFKTGVLPNNQDTSQDGNYLSPHVGFQAKYEFVSEPRESWNDIPTQGCCRDIMDVNKGWGGAVHYSEMEQDLLCDCIWSLGPFYNNIQLVIKVSNSSWMAEGDLFLSPDSTSAGMATFPPESQTSKKAGHDILFYSSFNSFYIRLRRRMTKGESFSFAFAPGTDEAMELLESHHATPAFCPYKVCHRHQKCEKYWLPCNDALHVLNSDSSCDDVEVEEFADDTCDNSRRCYNSSLDRCDNINDCDDRADEDGCSTGWNPQSMGLTMGFIFLVVLLVWCERKQYCKRRRGSCSRPGTCDCETLESCWKRCKSAPSAATRAVISRCRPSSTTDSRGPETPGVRDTANRDPHTVGSPSNRGPDLTDAFSGTTRSHISVISRLESIDSAVTREPAQSDVWQPPPDYDQVGSTSYPIMPVNVRTSHQTHSQEADASSLSSVSTSSLPSQSAEDGTSAVPKPPSYEDVIAAGIVIPPPATELPDVPPPAYETIK